jgi:hypothetical protein
MKSQDDFKEKFCSKCTEKEFFWGIYRICQKATGIVRTGQSLLLLMF